MHQDIEQPFDMQPAKPAGPGEQPKFKFAKSSVALGVIRMADQLAADQRMKDKMVQDAYDRIPPNDPAEMAANGEEWCTNVDWGDTEAVINEKVEQMNNLVMQAMPYISFKTRHGVNVNTVKALNRVALEHHFLFSESEFWVPEIQNMLLNMVAFGVGILHHSIPFSWHFKSQPRCNLVYPPQATTTPDDWPWMAIRHDIEITHLIDLLGNRVASNNMGWKTAAIAELISKFAWLPEGMGRDWLNNPEIWIAGIQENSLAIAANNKQGLRVFTMYVKEYDGKISESIIPQELGSPFIFQRKYDEYECMSDFISLFPLSVGAKFMEQIRGLGHRILPQMATENDFTNRGIDSQVLCGSLMLKDTPDANGSRDITKLELGQRVVFIPEDMTMDQKSFGNPAPGFVEMGNYMRGKRETNNRLFGGSDHSGNGPEATATEAKLQYGQATRSFSFESDRFYQYLTIFYRANWKRLDTIAEKGSKYATCQGYAQAKAMWDEIKAQGVTAEDLKVIRSVFANSMFGEGDPNQVFLAIQDLQGPISRMPLTSQREMDKMAVAARTRKPYLAEALFSSTDPLADRELSHQNWLTTQENGSFESSDLPVPIQDTDYHPWHVQAHTGYAEGVVQAYDQQVMPPDETLKRLIKTRDHVMMHMQILVRDVSQKELFAQAAKRWQGIENKMRQMQQNIQDAQTAEKQRAMEELKNPTLTVADQEKVLTGRTMRDELSRDGEVRRQQMILDAEDKRNIERQKALADVQLKVIEAAKPVSRSKKPA